MNTTLARVLAVVRILIGICFLWIGVLMLMDQELLYGGMLLRLAETGGPVRFYRAFALPYFERYETSLVFMAAAANIGVGLFFVTGTLISLTSLGAAALVLNYALASSSGNWPRFLTHIAVALALLLIGRLGAGLAWGVDGLLIERYKHWLVLFPLRRWAPGTKVQKRKSMSAASRR